MSDIPEALKALTPYVRRASEVEKTGDSRAYVVAYFCRSYAMDLGLKLSKGNRSGEVQGFLLNMMDQLEAAKKQHPELNDVEDCSDVVRTYALEKMTEAEDEYMSRKANKNTARRFYAAASFFEVLATFNDEKQLDEATKKQSLFAKWRATEILKAIKEGRPPEPTEEELQRARDADQDDDGDDGDDADVDFLPPPAPSGPLHTKVERDAESDEEEPYRPPPPKPAPTSRRTSSRSPKASAPTPSRFKQHASGSRMNVSDDQKSDALEYTRFATRALETDDVELAIKYLTSALRELEG